MNPALLIIKTGSTIPELRQRRGDFEDWIMPHLPQDLGQIRVVSVYLGEFLPPPEEVMGIIVTGSPAMVTDREGWSEYTALYLRGALDRQLPLLGICYGHQLIAHALGGQVDYNPLGREIGTRPLRLNAEARDDLLFADCDNEFPVHTTHSQSVVGLPRDTTLLGSNEYEAHHALRFGRLAWGLQFHPEFDQDIMRGYLEARWEVLSKEGLDADALLREVRPAEQASKLLTRFGDIVRDY